MKRFVFFVFVFFLLSANIAYSASQEKSSKIVLDNGLTVLVTEMPTSPIVSVYALVKAGSATEGKYLGAGLSHFLEHMLFKGTEDRAVGEIAAKVQAVGGSVNASTSKDYTIYTISIPSESFDVALNILSDMLIHSTLDAKEMEKERKVILGEMHLHNDNPDRRLNDMVYANAYLRHPYRHPVIGYESVFKEVTRDDLADYYHSFYIPNNTVLSIAGNVKTDEILSKIKEAFKDFKRSHDVLRNLPLEPTQITPRRYEEEYPTDLTRLSITFGSVSLLDPDLFALDVLAKILGDGNSSRFYLDIYQKKKLVYDISVSNYTPMDRGQFGIDAVLEEKNVDETIKAVTSLIEDVTKNGVRKVELEKAKKQVLSEYIFSRQTSSQIAYSQAVDEAFAGDYEFALKYIEGISGVTSDAIKAVARKYLLPSAMTVVVLKPKAAQAQQEVKDKSISAGEIQKFTLDNGLIILLREDHSVPIVSFRVMAQGGTRQEPIELNGLSKITAAMWLKGTKSYSATKIAEISESLGMDIDSYSGKNSLGLSLSALTQDFDAAINLFEELIKNPTFLAKEIPQVKDTIKAVIRQKQDDISSYTSHALRELLFTTDPLRLDDEGTMESVERITQNDIKNYYQQFLTPSNMVLTVFGDIDSDKVLDFLKKKFGSIKAPKVNLKNYQETPIDTFREKVMFMDKEQAMVMLGFHGVRIEDNDRYGLDILSSVLGSSFAGRLFNGVREKLGQAYTMGGDSLPGIDTGLIYFYVLTTDENVNSVKDILTREIKKLQTEMISDQELRDMKEYLKGNFKAERQTQASLSFISGLDELYGLGSLNYISYDKNIDGVTKEDIKRLANKYLPLDKAAIVVTRPLQHLPQK